MKLLPVLLCMLLAMGANSFTAVKAQIDINDSLALVDLYNSTNGIHWRYNKNWLTEKPVSTWYGIINANRRVTHVLLSYNDLKGTIPISIGNLDNVTDLSLEHNYLSGKIPSTLGNLKSIQQLTLFNNELKGAIPSTLGNLTEINTLDLSYNFLSKSIPHSFGNLYKLTFLNLNNNQLSGKIPSELGNLISLRTLYLSHNNLTRSISFKKGNFKNLISLDLSSNQITGSIPASLYNLANLAYVFADSNKLTGNIPQEIGKLITLRYLSLKGNQLTGSIPSEIGNLTIINYLHLEGNQLSGSVPSSVGDLKNLHELYLNNNQLSGSLPSSLINYERSTLINLSDNMFTFDGLEKLVHRYNYHMIYAPQASIPIHQHNNTLSLYAGGTLSNNTYKWFKVGKLGSTIIKGDSAFTPSSNGQYYAQVTNKVAKQLTLYSDTIEFTTNNLLADNRLPVNVNSKQSFSVYPNPASSLIHIQTNGTATITLTNSDGKVLLTKTINNTADINISSFANGTYFIQNKITGEADKIVVMH